jgi:hypothetical protein
VRACGLNSLVGYSNVKTCDNMDGKRDSKEGYLNREHSFPIVLRYKRGSDITEGDITDVRV